MTFLRGLGVTFAFIITFIIAKFANMNVLDMMIIVTFILTIDSLTCKFLVVQYMKGIAKEKKDE